MTMTIEELQAENSQLKKDLEHARSYKHTIKMRNRNLHTENENLKAELKDLRYNLDDWRNKADTMEARVKELEAELKQTEAQDQVVIDNLRKALHALWMARAKNADLMSCKESYNEYIREHPYSRWNDVRSAYSYATSFTNWSRWFQHISRTCLAKAKEFE